jgi:hypothetical protein
MRALRMRALQEGLALLLGSYRTISFCEGCLALKMGAFLREVQDALLSIGRRHEFQVSPGKCSECLQETTVVRALAA